MSAVSINLSCASLTRSDYYGPGGRFGRDRQYPENNYTFRVFRSWTYAKRYITGSDRICVLLEGWAVILHKEKSFWKVFGGPLDKAQLIAKNLGIKLLDYDC